MTSRGKLRPCVPAATVLPAIAATGGWHDASHYPCSVNEKGSQSCASIQKIPVHNLNMVSQVRVAEARSHRASDHQPQPIASQFFIPVSASASFFEYLAQSLITSAFSDLSHSLISRPS